jgi:hypothetical protein
MHYINKVKLALVLALLPSVSYAAEITDLKSLIAYIKELVNSIIPIIFGLALIGFIWGVTKYIYASSPAKLSEARSYMVFGIIAMTVMISIWGIAYMLKNTFFQSANTPYTPPASTQDTINGLGTDEESESLWGDLKDGN